MKDLKSERSRASLENKETDRGQKALKERQKRPDMQLYVPRALRGTEKKTVSLKNAENLNQRTGKNTSQKSAEAASLTNSFDNLPSVSSEQKHKKNSININLKPKSIKNEFDNAVQSSTDETVDECSNTSITSSNIAANETIKLQSNKNDFNNVVKSSSTDETVVDCSNTFVAVSNNTVANEALTISTGNTPTEMDDLQNFENCSSSCVQTVVPCYSNCIENVDNAVAPVCENATENIDKSVIIKSIPSNTLDSKKEENVYNVKSTSSTAVDAEPICSMIENIICSALNIKSEVSSTTTDMESLNISDKSDETVVSLKTAVSNNTLPKEEDDSWESMFDDNGECLDSDLVKELSSVTGKIQARAAKNNYTDYQPVSESMPQEYEHIVELYGFPREFVTQDLVAAFSVFQQSSFSIKWVDDCHALAIFTSPALANQALQMKHPFMKVRPLSEGIKESKAKARWCAHHAEPQKPRPATSAVLARRLVSGALGLRVQATKEQRDHERNVLKEAKEKRRLKAKQKEAIWDGSVI